MAICLLITSGGGPLECRLAVGHVLRRMRDEAEGLGLDLSISDEGPAPASVIVLVEGAGADTLARDWVGTILWRQHSTLRPNHKRANWFVGVFALPQASPGQTIIPASEVTFASFRAGGPGGQHQNTTDSAVRATWQGFTALSRDERSQHRNKAKALERLQHLVDAAQAERQSAATQTAHRLHRTLERGNPRRSFSGPDFTE
jgi:peptide chain release factor